MSLRHIGGMARHIRGKEWGLRIMGGDHRVAHQIDAMRRHIMPPGAVYQTRGLPFPGPARYRHEPPGVDCISLYRFSLFQYRGKHSGLPGTKSAAGRTVGNIPPTGVFWPHRRFPADFATVAAFRHVGRIAGSRRDACVAAGPLWLRSVVRGRWVELPGSLKIGVCGPCGSRFAPYRRRYGFHRFGPRHIAAICFISFVLLFECLVCFPFQFLAVFCPLSTSDR